MKMSENESKLLVVFQFTFNVSKEFCLFSLESLTTHLIKIILMVFL